MRNFNDITIYPPLLREMADDIERCLAKKNPGELLGCISAICAIFKYEMVPAISRRQYNWAKENGEENG